MQQYIEKETVKSKVHIDSNKPLVQATFFTVKVKAKMTARVREMSVIYRILGTKIK